MIAVLLALAIIGRPVPDACTPERSCATTAASPAPMRAMPDWTAGAWRR